MTTGAPPPNFVFNSSKNIAPSFSVQPRLYNEAGFIPHPLQHFGSPGGALPSQSTPPAGSTVTGKGQLAQSMAFPTFYTLNGKPPHL